MRLGLTAFGGPAAHIAMMEAEVVTRRGWVTSSRFLDLLGAANLLPGPSSSELAIYLGFERGGLPGLLVAGVCFILPAALLTGVLAWAYVRFGALPHVSGMLQGIKPVIVAIVGQAVWSLAPRAVKTRWLGGIGLASVLACSLGVESILVLLVAGLLAAVAHRPVTPPSQPLSLLLLLGPGAVTVPAVSVPLGAIFVFFLKTGAVTFGSGYVLLAFLRADLVDRWHWLTEAQLLDAVAAGQVTPGPVFTTATFLGYLLGGVPGAVLATVGIFLPGFVFVLASRSLLARVRESEAAGAFLDGVSVASLALMVVVTAQLGRAAIVDVLTLVIFGVALLLLVRWKLNSAWLMAAGALLGILSRVLVPSVG